MGASVGNQPSPALPPVRQIPFSRIRANINLTQLNFIIININYCYYFWINRASNLRIMINDDISFKKPARKIQNSDSPGSFADQPKEGVGKSDRPAGKM